MGLHVRTELVDVRRWPRVGCDVCGAHEAHLIRSASALAADLARARSGLDDVILDHGADIFRCACCGSLFRDADGFPEDLEDAYRRAPYDVERVDRIRRRARADLVRDRRHLRRYGMERGARLLEIGSYVGAFLEVARQLGCSAVGVDLNPDLCRYSIDRGHDVRNAPFSADDFDGEQFDGVWILNCFEALPDLDGTLHDVRRMLRPEGWLVIRTPNASFVCLAHAEQAGRWLRPVADANALLGMPFRRCLSVRGITTLFVRHGFGRVHVRGREFSSLGPEGCSAAWAASRPLRGAAYSVASRLAGQPVHPWLEVAASPRPDW